MVDIIKFKNQEKADALDANLNQFLESREKYQNNPIVLAEIKSNVIAEINLYMTDDKIQLIKDELENKSYGFRTDRTIESKNLKALGSYGTKPGYPIEVIKEATIFGLLKGVHYTDNELNIIAGRGYITKEGFQGMMRRNPDFGDFQYILKTDEIIKSKSVAIVHAKAMWKYRGKEYTTPDKFQVSVRYNEGMLNDAIIGKAERKVRRYACEVSFNDTFSDGEPEEVERTVIEIEAEVSDD